MCFSTVGDPKSSRKSRTNNRKSKTVQAETKKNSNNNRRSTNNNKSQHQVAATNGKQQHKKGTKAVQTFWKVKSGKGMFFTQQQQQGGPNARGPNPEKLRPRGVGSRRVGWGGEGGGASSRGNAVGYRQILRSKGSNQLSQIVVNILEGHTLQRWDWRGFDGRRPKQQQAQAAAKNSGSSKPQQEHKQQEKQQQATESGAAQTAQNNNPEKVRAPKVGKRAPSRGISFGCVRGSSFWIQATFAIIGR